MTMRGRQTGEKSQSQQKTLVRSEGISRFAGNSLLISLLVLSIPGRLCAQQTQQPSPITLQHAINIALEKNPERKAALADTRAASADVREARSFPRERPCIRIWQQIAAAAVHDGRLRAERPEYANAVRQLRDTLWRHLESL